MSLVILIPLKPSMDPIKEPRLPRPILILPSVRARVLDPFLQVEELLVLVEVLRGLVLIESLGGQVGHGGRGGGVDGGGGEVATGDEGGGGDEVAGGELFELGRSGVSTQTQKKRQRSSEWN